MSEENKMESLDGETQFDLSLFNVSGETQYAEIQFDEDFKASLGTEDRRC